MDLKSWDCCIWYERELVVSPTRTQLAVRETSNTRTLEVPKDYLQGS
jgi:hypothetical protein